MSETEKAAMLANAIRRYRRARIAEHGMAVQVWRSSEDVEPAETVWLPDDRFDHYTWGLGGFPLQTAPGHIGYDVLARMIDKALPAATAPRRLADCDHGESLYGRCVKCGRTWEQQAVDALPLSTAQTEARLDDEARYLESEAAD
jgi:hypothetical protein